MLDWGSIPISMIFLLEFWEDDEETRIGGRAGMVHLPHEGDESEDGDRADPTQPLSKGIAGENETWFLFTLQNSKKITEMDMLPQENEY